MDRATRTTPELDSEHAARASLRDRRILLVDDNLELIKGWARLLQGIGMHCMCANSLKDANEALANNTEQRLDFAIIDDRLPDGFGQDLVPSILSLRPATLYVVVTADRSDARVFAGWQHDIVLLPKPMNRDSLLALVEHMSARRTAEERTGLPSDRALVLIVDDSESAVELLTDSLRDDYRVEASQDGYAGLRKAIQLRPDVIISDMAMPGLNGAQLIRLLRARPETSQIPVVLCTAQNDESLRLRILREGAQDYLVKPFSKQELLARVGNLAAIARSRALLESGSDQHQGLDALVKQAIVQKRHAEFMSEASKMLGASLEYRATLKRVLRLFVTGIGGGALVDLLDAHGVVENVALAHSDPSAEYQLAELRQSWHLGPSEQHSLVRALGTGQLETFGHEPGLLDRLQVRSGLSAPLIARGRLIGAFTVYSSTDAKPLGAAELALCEDLAHRIALAVDHAELYREAKDAIAARDEFLSIASHELKTPLNPLALQIQSLYRKADQYIVESERDRVKQKLHAVWKQAQRLTRLVNDLLDLSRISAGRVEYQLEQVDLSEVVREVITQFEEHDEVARSRCTLQVELAPDVFGIWDRMRLDQVVTNLLSNALKYGAGTEVSVTTRLRGGTAELHVRDRGIGISPEDQARIFGRFERAVSARHYGGLGLGLFIVRELVEGLGGTVHVRSNPPPPDTSASPDPNQGTVFIVCLPVVRSS